MFLTNPWVTDIIIFVYVYPIYPLVHRKETDMKKLDDAHYRDLYYRDNRLMHYSRIMAELQYTQTEKLTGWKHVTGDFMGPEVPGFDTSAWEDFGEFDRFGGRFAYGWFCGEITVPESFDGRLTSLNILSTVDGSDDVYRDWTASNPGYLCYINGRLAGHFDRFHRSVVLTENAVAGEKFYIALKYWTEFGRKDFFCPVLRAIDPDVRDLYYDLRCIWEWEEAQTWADGYRMEMLSPVSEAIALLDMRDTESDAFRKSVRDAHGYIWEHGFNGKWKNDALGAKVLCIGHSHMDIAWMWRISQTREKARRTFVNALNYIDTDPDFTFFCSQPAVYRFVQEDDPALFERVKAAVRSGRWEADGGMWVEADCNLTSGEGFVRQFLYGMKYFREELGVEPKMLWLPDVFGYSAALPQILRGFGLNYFTTAKINNNEYNCMPHDTFVWKGIDGSEVFTHLICGSRCSRVLRGDFATTYNTDLAPDYVNGTWKRYHDKELTDEIFLPVGWGDGGGGTADYMIEFGKRMNAGLPGSVRTEWGHVGAWFDKWSASLAGKRYLPVWDGELYFEKHRGTLTTMARIKKANRKAEFLYQKAEWLGVLAQTKLGTGYDRESLEEGWKLLLINQFHDILPGSSVKEVYEDADADYEKIFATGNFVAEEMRDRLVSNISGSRGDVVVFNPSGFDRCDAVAIKTDAKGISGAISQRSLSGELVFNASVPSKGWAVFSPVDDACSGQTVSVCDNTYETSYWRITFDENGNIVSLYDKSAKREAVNGRANLMLGYEDIPLKDDAWDVNVHYKFKYRETKLTRSTLTENGPVYAVITQERTFNKSLITQKITLWANNPRIDFVTEIDWNEKNILLKAHFPVAVNTDKATYDIQFGSIKRNTHGNTSWDFAKFEVCGHKWADVSDSGYGAAVLNDCKYGYSANGSDIALSLLRGTAFPNPDADREHHSFTYSFLPHAGDLASSTVIENGYLLNVPMEAYVKSEDGGELEREFSLARVISGSAVIEAVKPAENGDGFILRLYEPRGRRSKVSLGFGFAADVEKTDLGEVSSVPIGQNTRRTDLELSAFEIVTLRLRATENR